MGADKMESMLQSNQSKQNSENAETLRQILENLFYFSFEEERIQNTVKQISKNDPGYITLKQNQQTLMNNYTIISDSLYALSKRQVGLGAHINDKAFDIERRLITIDKLHKEDKISSSTNEIRYIINNANDLILLLSESLKQMDQMSGSGGGGESS